MAIIALTAVLALAVAAIVWTNGGSERAAAAAADPYGELVIRDFSGDNDLVSEIKSHSWDVFVPLTNGNPSGPPQFSSLVVTRSTDASSPRLARAVARQFQYDTVIVRIFKPGTTQIRSAFRLENILIVDFDLSGRNEKVSFIYESVDWSHGAGEFCWDLGLQGECST